MNTATPNPPQTALAPEKAPLSPPVPLERKQQDKTETSADSHPHKPDKGEERTPGLKLFDVFLYPILTNFVVFGMSVGATYLTIKGGDRKPNGDLVHGKFGEFFFKRGEWLVNKFRGMGMSRDQADMSKMVFFSFADGTLISPMVKMLEDRREKIAYSIDKKLGTVPEDHSVYDCEPKQSWGSVIGGRLATCSIVVPTAYALDKMGLNDVLFSKPGLEIGKAIEKQPGIAKYFGKLDIPVVSKVAAFELFYTSVCTGGLYVLSRTLARITGKHESDATTEMHEEHAAKHRMNPAFADGCTDVRTHSYTKSVQQKASPKTYAQFTDRAADREEMVRA